MQFGVNVFIWTASFTREHYALLSEIKARGFDSVEIPLFRPADFPAAEIGAELRRHDLDGTICSVLTDGHNLISEDASVRRKSIEHMKSCAASARAMGAKLVAGPLYSPVGYLPGRRRTADEWSWCVEAYRELGPVFEEQGIEVAIEPLNRFETYFLNTAEDATLLCDEIGHPSVGVLFDTFHANIEEKSVADGYRTVARHLKHVHACENDRGIPGSGHVEWGEVFAALREIGYDRRMTIESFGFTLGDLSAAAAIWRDLAPSPETIAWEGVKFLRAGVGN